MSCLVCLDAILVRRAARYLAGIFSGLRRNMETLREAGAAAFRGGKFREALALYEECLSMPEA